MYECWVMQYDITYCSVMWCHAMLWVLYVSYASNERHVLSCIAFSFHGVTLYVCMYACMQTSVYMILHVYDSDQINLSVDIHIICTSSLGSSVNAHDHHNNQQLHLEQWSTWESPTKLWQVEAQQAASRLPCLHRSRARSGTRCSCPWWTLPSDPGYFWHLLAISPVISIRSFLAMVHVD